MKRILLILSLLITIPILGMQTAHASVWSWSSLISCMTTTISQKPALIGLGALAVAAATYGVYNFYKIKQPEALRPQPQHLYPDQEYQPVIETLKNISPNQQGTFKNFLLMLKKATESDLLRLEHMLKENMVGIVSFDCLHVWDMHTEIASQMPLRTIKDYMVFVRGFSTTPLTTQKDVQQACANIKSLKEAVEQFLIN